MRAVLSLGILLGGALLGATACADGTTAPPAAPERFEKRGLAGRGIVRTSASPDALLNGTIPVLDVSGGSRFYTVFVDESPAEFGIFTVGTGADHPVTTATGARQGVLYGGSDADPFSSYLTVRSYTSNTDYTQGGFGSTTRQRVALRPGERGITAAVATVAGGFRTTYTLPGPGADAAGGTPDRLRIEQLVRANGTTFDAAAVEVTTVVTNTGAASVKLGLRYLWDTQVGLDDGPAFFTRTPDAGPIADERAFAPPAFQFFQVQSNRDPAVPVYRVFGTVAGPAGVAPAPGGATRVVHASWPDAYNAAFDYAVDASRTPGCVGGCDGAVLYYLGDAESNAVTLAPGASLTYSQSLAAGTTTSAPARFSNRAPVPKANGPYSGTEGAAIAFSAAGSSDPDGDALSYAWDFTGDGVTDRTGASASWTYADNGAYSARLTVTDARGASAVATAPVTVANAAPRVERVFLNLPWVNSPPRGAPWPVEFLLADAGTADQPWSWTIDWGDGTAPATGVLLDQSQRVSRDHVYTTAGSKTVRITVRDKDGATGTRTLAVVVR